MDKRHGYQDGIGRPPKIDQLETEPSPLATDVIAIGRGADTKKATLAAALAAGAGAVAVTGARSDPEAALANLLTVLDGLGIITDSTTAI